MEILVNSGKSRNIRHRKTMEGVRAVYPRKRLFRIYRRSPFIIRYFAAGTGHRHQSMPHSRKVVRAVWTNAVMS